MNAEERIRQKVSRVGEMYPDQHERLVKCADVVVERGTDWLYVAFEKQLDQIANMKSGEKVSRTIDKMEHTMFESSIMSPFLGAHESKGRKRFWIMVLVGIVLVLAIAGTVAPNLVRLL